MASNDIVKKAGTLPITRNARWPIRRLASRMRIKHPMIMRIEYCSAVIEEFRRVKKVPVAVGSVLP